MVDAKGAAYVPLGNGFDLYPGQDSNLGADDAVVRFGRYPQSDPTGAKADPLSWRLMDIQGSRAVLVANVQLDAIRYNLQQLSDGNDYARSNLRSWLNSRGGRDVPGDVAGFYNVAFTETEKAKIVPTRLDQPAGPPFAANTPETVTAHPYSTAPMDIQDPVWALSGEETIRWFGPSKRTEGRQGGGSAVTSGLIVPTAYARARGVKINVGGNGPETIGYGDSWLRTPGVVDSTTAYGIFLSSLGNLNGHRPVTNVYGALPAVTVDLGGAGKP
jgi:hypothetical protein